jgi:hypothetical protein
MTEPILSRILPFLRAFILYMLIMGVVVVTLLLYSAVIYTNNPLLIIASLTLVIKLCMIAFKWFGEVE